MLTLCIRNDLDYMDGYRVFSLNEETYPKAEFQAFLGKLRRSVASVRRDLTRWFRS